MVELASPVPRDADLIEPYAAFELDVQALTCEREYRTLFSGLSLKVANSELVRVEGCNGSGKSTLLRALVGLNSDVDGSIYWNRETIQRSETYRQQLLYIGHQPGVKAELTAMENLRWLVQCSSLSAPGDSALLGALKAVRLFGFSDSLAGQLSAGQKRRIALARLWVENCPLWVLDEPFTALDAEGIELLQLRMESHIDQQGSILFTTHQMPSFALPWQSLKLESFVNEGISGHSGEAL